MTRLRHIAATAAILGLAAGPAEGAVTSVTEDYSAPFGSYGGRTYVYKEVTLNGTVDRPDPKQDGTYSVGMVLIYPSSDGNGMGIVDWTNTVYMYIYESICPRREPFCDAAADGDAKRRLESTLFQFAPLAFEDYMWDQGYTYAAVQWDKTVVEFFGESPPDKGRHNRLAFGRIDDPSDAWTILSDAARFLRDPQAYEGGPGAVENVIAFGFSQGSQMGLTYVAEERNVEADGTTLIYDGFLQGMVGFECWELESVTPTPLWTRYGYVGFNCPLVTNHGSAAKVMVVSSESELDLSGGFFTRGDGTDPNYIQYELAGIAHLSATILDASIWGATQQNPADPRPFFRGALRNMTDWIRDDTPPPPAIPLDGTEDLETKPPTWTPSRDADGNTTGGIRLPHMPSTIDGMPAGAPTGVYTGSDFAGLDPLNFFYALAGTYTPFSDDELAERYPTADDYKTLIERSADQLLADRYILQEDHDRYLAGTPDLPVPDPDPSGDGDDGDDDGDGGCSAASSHGPSPLLLVAALFGLVMFRRRSRGPGTAVQVAIPQGSRSTRLARILSVIVGATCLAACYGDEEGSECRGHECANAPINLPEGGEVRLEIAYVKDSAPEIRTAIWFATDQTPASRDWPRLPLNWNGIAGGDDALCADMRSGAVWPSGDPQARAYLDVGETVTLAGGDKNFVFERGENVEDNAYRNVSDIGYTAQIEPGEVAVGTEYTVALSGSADQPATTLDPGIYLPSDYALEFPNMDETVLVPQNEDFPFLWTPPPSVDEFMFSFVAFTDQIDPLVFCIGGNSGQMVVPQEFIETLPPGGAVLHGVLEHRVTTSPDRERRIDLLGVNCRYGQYVITSGDP